MLAACSSVRPVYNAELTPSTKRPGYRLSALPPTQDNGNELFITVALSGGGARSAALAYAVLEALKETRVEVNGKVRTLFSEVDVVSAVSGGSLAAAYLAVHGEDMFPSFYAKVLMRDLQGEFIRELFSPTQMGWMFSERFGRSDVLASFLDREIFGGTRYADILAKGKRPWIAISATDMSLGSRFDFIQDQFDLLCSDLGSVHLATAVAASSAVPIALSPITLKNYRSPCVIPGNLDLYGFMGSRQQARLSQSAMSYFDKDGRAFIHLLDGGLSDNQATRGALEAAQVQGGFRALVDDAGANGMRWFVFVSVNAEGHAGFDVDKSDRVPSIFRVAQAVADVPLSRMSNDSLELLKESMASWAKETNAAGPTKLNTYFIEVNLENIKTDSDRNRLRLLPTSLSLPADDVDAVIGAGKRLFVQSPELKRLLGDLQAAASSTPLPHNSD